MPLLLSRILSRGPHRSSTKARLDGQWDVLHCCLVWLTRIGAAVQDGQAIGDGSVGPVTVKLNAMMERDAMASLAPDGAEPTRHLPVPYGYVTHMPAADEEDED